MSMLSTKDRRRLERWLQDDRFKSLRRYLRHNANQVNAVLNRRQHTALHVAAKRGSHECVRVLLSAGASAQVPDRDGNFALYYAAKRCLRKGNIELLKDLVLPLKAASLPVLHTTNKKGLSCQDFLDALDEELEMLMEEEEVGEMPVKEDEKDDSDNQRNEEEIWREKLELNAREDLFDRMGSHHVLESPDDDECRAFIGESFDTWADRIYSEFIRQRQRQRRIEEKPTSKPFKEPSAFQNNLKLKPKTEPKPPKNTANTYSRFKSKFLMAEHSDKTIRLRSFPFSVDTPPSEIVNLLLNSQMPVGSCGVNAEENSKMMRLILREEIRLWHPDKFMPKFRTRCHPNDVEQISDLVNHVAQALINYGK